MTSKTSYECDFCHATEPAWVFSKHSTNGRPEGWVSIKGAVVGDFCTVRCLALWAVQHAQR